MADLTPYEYDIFLSHNHADQEWTTKLAERLEQEDWQGRKLKVFFSPWDIRPGQSIPKEIERALPKSCKVGLIMSPDAIDSAWVELERLVTTYIAVSARNERLVPLYRRTCEVPPLLRPVLCVDFRNDADFEEGYQTLLSVVRDEPLPRRSRTSTGNATLLPLVPRPPVVGFVARRDSEGRDIVERLKEELAPQKSQLIALSGPGGVGKTTLAGEATRALIEGFGQRIVWISALRREDFALSTLLDDITTQLGAARLRTLAPVPKAEQVQAVIAAAPTLIILDNFETIKTAEQTRCVEFLLNQATCPTLITTRQKITSARNITIPVMSREEADDFLERLIDQASDPSAFAQLDRDRIMKASERNPLVLQWVVSQIDLAQEAHTVLDELAHGAGDAAQRVFDRSFGLEHLGDDGRAALLALSLFAPDASRTALAAVAGFGEDVKRLNKAVKGLAGLWLLRTTAVGSRLTVEGLTRELAKARLLSDERAGQFRERFVAFFRRHAESHNQPTAEDYQLLEPEKENLLNAMVMALVAKDWESVMETRSAMEEFLDVHGHWDDAIRSGKQALKAARELPSDCMVALFVHNLGRVAQGQGELDKARGLYVESVEINKKLGNLKGIARSWHNLAVIARNRGELDEARRLCLNSLRIEKRLHNQGGIASSLHQLGRLAQDRGKLDKARRRYNESLEIAKKQGDQGPVAITLHQLGRLAQEQGELDEARRLYNASLEINRRLGKQDGIASSLHQLGRLARDQCELDEARRLYNESLEIAKKLGDQGGVAVTLHQLGRLAEDEGHNSEAARLFGEALAIFEKLKLPYADLARRSLERVKGKSS